MDPHDFMHMCLLRRLKYIHNSSAWQTRPSIANARATPPNSKMTGGQEANWGPEDVIISIIIMELGSKKIFPYNFLQFIRAEYLKNGSDFVFGIVASYMLFEGF